MRVQDFIAELTQANLDKFLREVAKVPADKLTWSPLDEGRTVLSMMQELGVIPAHMPHILETFEPPTFDESFMQQFFAACAELDTFEKAEEAIRVHTQRTIEAIREVQDEELDREIPFYGGQMWTVKKLMCHHFTNLEYHTGQVCYIQTLYGDKSM